ncbi:MAG: hypothetical protein ACRCX4_07970 [Bacteroidales bacterium]
MKKVLFVLFVKIPLIILLLILAIGSTFYLFSPVYDFEEPKPFAGENIYNPYADVDTSQWKRANFHAHHRMWGGVTNGGCSEEELLEAYKGLNYDFIGISNYQHMTDYNKGKDTYLPVYEHGWGICKFHQLVFGAENATWKEYPFFMTLSEKQNILNSVGKGADLIVFNHPRFTRGLKPEEMHYLTGYDMIEAVSGMASSTNLWDEALSAGHSSFIVANDDSHNINKLYQLARYATFVNVPTTKYDDLILALKKGATYGLRIPNFGDGALDIKKKENANLPVPAVSFENDTITIRLSQKADSIRIIGQNGERKAFVADTNMLVYPFAKADTYVRAEAKFANGVDMYLNPFFRYSGGNPLAKQDLAKFSFAKTLLYSFAWMIILIILLYLIYRVVILKSPSSKKRRR